MEVVLLLQYGMVVFVVWFVCSLVDGGGEVKRSYPGRSCKSDRSLVKETFRGELAWRSCYCYSMGWWFLLLFLGGGGEGVISRQYLEIG